MIAQEQGRDDASSLQPVNEQASLFPFPNRTSFELLDWFWRDGDKKTQENFGHLVDILKSDKFSQEDLWETSWESIHRSLAADDPDSAEWEDAGSSGWRTTPVSINVPLRQVAHEGPHMFNAGSVHYRPLVSMILDKLNASHSHQFFHYEPYPLHWNAAMNPPISRFMASYTHQRPSLKLIDKFKIFRGRLVAIVHEWSSHSWQAQMPPISHSLGMRRCGRSTCSTATSQNIGEVDQLWASVNMWHTSAR